MVKTRQILAASFYYSRGSSAIGGLMRRCQTWQHDALSGALSGARHRYRVNERPRNGPTQGPSAIMQVKVLQPPLRYVVYPVPKLPFEVMSSAQAVIRLRSTRSRENQSCDLG